MAALRGHDGVIAKCDGGATSRALRSRLLDVVQRGEIMTTWTEKCPCVYMLASTRNGILYIGVTSELAARISVHKQDLIAGFTSRYGVHRLVYYEMHDNMNAAIRREKQLKKWKRAWKVRLIQSMNPEWIDLFDETSGAILEGPADTSRIGGASYASYFDDGSDA
jgi:putative endonuclease